MLQRLEPATVPGATFRHTARELLALSAWPLGSFVPGPYGQALQGGSAVSPYQANYVDTGWAPSVTGDYTWAMWMYNSRGNPGPGLTYIAGIPV